MSNSSANVTDTSATDDYYYYYNSINWTFASDGLIAPSAVSMASCSLVISYLLYFRHRYLSKNSYEIILYMAISNVLTASGTVVGFVQSGTFACWWQGIMSNAFTLSSIFWNVVLELLLLSTFVCKRPYKVDRYAHAICWGVPALVTLLPLINMSYGQAGVGSYWCWIVETDSTPPWAMDVWSWVSYYAWIWIALGTISLCRIYIGYRIISDLTIGTRRIVKEVLSQVKWYPLVVAGCWGFVTVSDTSGHESLGTNSALFVPIINFIACLQGFFTAIIFFTTLHSQPRTPVRSSSRSSSPFTFSSLLSPKKVAVTSGEKNPSISWMSPKDVKMSVSSPSGNLNMQAKQLLIDEIL